MEVREGTKRQHRAIALYAVIQCWTRGLDGLIFTRNHFKRLLNLERFKETRLHWLKEDFGDFFPFVETSSFNTYSEARLLCVSRIPVGMLPWWRYGSDRWKSEIKKVGRPNLGLFNMWGYYSMTAEWALEHVGADDETSDFRKFLEPLVSISEESAEKNEKRIYFYLSLLTQGLIVPRDIPGFISED